jgi:hypothetical protein
MLREPLERHMSIASGFADADAEPFVNLEHRQRG